MLFNIRILLLVDSRLDKLHILYLFDGTRTNIAFKKRIIFLTLLKLSKIGCPELLNLITIKYVVCEEKGIQIGRTITYNWEHLDSSESKYDLSQLLRKWQPAHEYKNKQFKFIAPIGNRLFHKKSISLRSKNLR